MQCSNGYISTKSAKMKSIFCVSLGSLVQEWKCKKYKQKVSKPNGGKNKLTCTIWEKKKSWHMVQHMAVWKDNWMDCLESSLTYKSIGWSTTFCMGWSFYKYLFSKPSLGSLWQKSVTQVLCKLFESFVLLILNFSSFLAYVLKLL